MSDYNRSFNGEAKIKLTQVINEGMRVMQEVEDLVRWIWLINCRDKSFNKGFVNDVCGAVSPIIGTPALGVCGSNHVKPLGRGDDFTNLFDQNWLAF